MQLVQLPHMPYWIQLGFLLLSLLCLLLIHRSTAHISISVHFSKGEQLSLRRWLVYYPAAWIMLVCAIATTGFFNEFSKLPPRMSLLIIVPIIYLVVLLRRPLFRAFIDRIPLSWMLMLQSFRIPVEIFLWGLFTSGWVPVQMTFEGYNFDILSGILGLLLGLYFLKNPDAPRWLAQAYNLVGMTLLLNIVSIALLSTPAPFRVFMNEPANIVVTLFPVVVLPAFLVPLAYYLHIACWVKRP